jgi:hypothetical protein
MRAPRSRFQEKLGLTTNSSSLSFAAMAAGTKEKDRVKNTIR